MTDQSVKKRMGRPPHEPTEERKRLVKALAGVGVRHEDISVKLGITPDTLVKHYSHELAEGRIEANAAVAQTLFQQAKAGNITAAIFWMKTRAQWRESHHLEVSGDQDNPMQMKVTWAQEK
jgi:hypothetical protein